MIGLWCNGSTTGFGSVCPGSNPGSPTKKESEFFTRSLSLCLCSLCLLRGLGVCSNCSDIINCSIHSVHFLGTHFGHYLAKVFGISATEEYGEALLKPVKDVRCRQFKGGFSFLGQSEYLIEDLFFR